jgi:hypothetical protein
VSLLVLVLRYWAAAAQQQQQQQEVRPVLVLNHHPVALYRPSQGPGAAAEGQQESSGAVKHFWTPSATLQLVRLLLLLLLKALLVQAAALGQGPKDLPVLVRCGSLR